MREEPTGRLDPNEVHLSSVGMDDPETLDESTAEWVNGETLFLSILEDRR